MEHRTTRPSRGRSPPSSSCRAIPCGAKHVAGQLSREGRAVHRASRNMLGFTGEFKGRRVSVMASGMGGPLDGHLLLRALRLLRRRVSRAHRHLRRPHRRPGGRRSRLRHDLELGLELRRSIQAAWQLLALRGLRPSSSEPWPRLGSGGYRFWVGNTFSSDHFSLYSALDPEEGWKKWARMGCAATDMESYALYCNAAYLGKKALAMFTCSGLQRHPCRDEPDREADGARAHVRTWRSPSRERRKARAARSTSWRLSGIAPRRREGKIRVSLSEIADRR